MPEVPPIAPAPPALLVARFGRRLDGLADGRASGDEWNRPPVVVVEGLRLLGLAHPHDVTEVVAERLLQQLAMHCDLATTRNLSEVEALFQCVNQ
jgi:hypothetical protein